MQDVNRFVIRQKLWLIGRLGKVRARILFDTGANVSLIRDDLARKIEDVDELLGRAHRCYSATGSFMVRPGMIADVEISRYPLMANLCVAKELTEDVILGDDFMGRWGLMLDPKHRRVMVEPEYLRLQA